MTGIEGEKMKGTTQMIVTKEQMMAMVEHYLNSNLFLLNEHKSKVVDQIRKSGDRFVITFEGEPIKNAERPKPFDSDLSRPNTEAIGGAPPSQGDDSITDCPLQEN